MFGIESGRFPSVGSGGPEEDPAAENRRIVGELQRQEAEEKERKKKLRELRKQQGEKPKKRSISERERPTVKQLALLEEFKVEVPPTKRASARMISFILDSNGATNAPKTKEKRASYLASAQKNWNHQEVKYLQGDRIGTVRYIYPRNREEVVYGYRVSRGPDNDKPTGEVSVFDAVVDWKDFNEDQGATTVSLSTLTRIEDSPVDEEGMA